MDQSIEVEPVDGVDAAWAEVEARWDDAEVHRRFLSRCRLVGRLDEAGRRYRHIRDTDPARADMAKRQINALLALALANLAATRTEPPAVKRWILTVGWVLIGFLLLYALVQGYRLLQAV